MPWVKLTDDWYDDPDLIEAGPLSMLVWPLLIAWSTRNLQDGKIPAGQVRRLVDWSALGAEPEQAIAPLVACGRLQAVESGYVITNFLKYQPSREKVLSDREKDKQRKAAGRSASPNGVRPTSVRNPDPPDPVPDPDNPSSSSTSDLVPEAVWDALAREKAKTSQVGDFGKWSKTVIRNAKAEHGERAEWIWSTYVIDPSHLATVLLTGDGRSLNTLQKRQAA